ncbi:ABC transporter permease [Frondihabitans australicus]|uniref:Putative spermidine/putrescine transport system permease protein n=1 Tax=Frondihabitans australicus TaxID=386892 RepID=A0A495IHH2_9MICO|nr:ABC transporter permease subunit [Frondihabitans australicus]RKR75437.1 putative spermidine/putrescine transport system permease protein [Frondihabitans australicus]
MTTQTIKGTPTASADAAVSSTVSRGAGAAKPRRLSAAWLGFTPFAAYVVLFLAIPAVIAVASGFFSESGAFTLANLKALTDSTIINNFTGSLLVSAISAILGAVIGALVCFALLGTKAEGLLRTAIDAASSVLAQFGGVMLAFAFIATIGFQGFVTLFLKNTFGFDINANGALLYKVPGLIIPYTYFDVPLMVLTFMPAMEGLKATWGEAAATLGATRFHYWTRIAMPVLTPAFAGSVLLLFANSFSSFATAAALLSQGGIVPLAIKQQLTSETIVGVANTAGVLALGMLVIMVIIMFFYSLLQRRAARWQR